MTERLTTVCTTCGNVLWADEAASHYCNPRRIAELEWRVADLEKRLTAALTAFAIAKSVREGREVITPGHSGPRVVPPMTRETAKTLHPATRAARPALQVISGPGRTATDGPARPPAQVSSRAVYRRPGRVPKRAAGRGSTGAPARPSPRCAPPAGGVA